jgi:precorrin-6x reductase
MRVAFVGNRDWTDKERISYVMEEYILIASEIDETLTVVSGGAQGADKLSEEVAKELGLDTLIFNAQWKLYGKAAGHIRNKKMLVDSEPDLVIAFMKKNNESKGTKNCISTAEKLNIPVIIVSD